MNQPKAPVAVVALTEAGALTGRRIADALSGNLHGLSGRVANADITFHHTATHLRGLFENGTGIIAVMASGALVRLLAPALADKHAEPPVLSLSEDGGSVVPLLGGHHGANNLSLRVADICNGHAAITTAGDVRFGIALDNPPAPWRLANPQAAKAVMAALLDGAGARLNGTMAGEGKAWLAGSGLVEADDGAICLTFSNERREPAANELIYCRPDTVIGTGCERGADGSELIALAEAALEKTGLATGAVACIATIDLKADEVAMDDLARHFGVPLRLFTAAELEAQADRLENPSDIVFAEVGCHGVAEGAALAGAGALTLPKRKSARATVALGRSDGAIDPMDLGRARGHLAVVGIGPGSDEWRSPHVSRLVSEADDLVGYSLYLDLLGGLTRGKTRHDFDLGAEEKRVRHAMELAGQGKRVSLVCSGDAGIYAMATLVFELLADGGLSNAAQRIAIEVSPGISALQAAAARAGAPLGHDFCTISLSDLLTPWPDIQRRLRAAAEGDFVIAFYNPVSRRRRMQLAYARDELLKHRPADTPVILASNLGRDGEAVRVVPLAELNIDDVDMLTVVIVGSSDTRTVETGDGRTWVYTPRGYAAKDGTGIGA